jgi:uncharacterized protein (DUF362 family)/Pyruvate/2-oxoacid:ferredoxin oxidoreductase delta subunit
VSKVMIHPANYGNVRQAVEWAFEIFPLALTGKTVLIKPNLLRSSKADEGIVTNPAVLRAVVEKVETLKPSMIVVGDNPGIFGYGANEECFKTTGLMEAAKGYYQNIGNDAQSVPFNPDFMPMVSVSRIVLDADFVISLPKFKTHSLTVISGAIKNSYGFLPGALKAKLHKAAGNAERFHEMLIDVFRLRVPDLFIMDAVVGMEGNGPASPDLRDIGLILASDNAVAMDAVVAIMMGCEPGRLQFLRKAKETGLGNYDLRTIEVIGELKELPNFKLPPLSGASTLNNEAMQAVIHNRTILRPQADSELCTGCGACIDQCTVSALSMSDDNIPRVDADTCIACFCCQELCPEKAITLQ